MNANDVMPKRPFESTFSNWKKLKQLKNKNENKYMTETKQFDKYYVRVRASNPNITQKKRAAETEIRFTVGLWKIYHRPRFIMDQVFRLYFLVLAR